jgi:hypothetical protein
MDARMRKQTDLYRSLSLLLACGLVSCAWLAATPTAMAAKTRAHKNNPPAVVQSARKTPDGSLAETTEAAAQPLQNGEKAPKSRRKGKRVNPEAQLQLSTPVLDEIMALKWESPTDTRHSDETRRVGLERIFHETLGNSIAIRQAEVQVKDSQRQAKEAGELNLFNLLNPIQPAILKQAAENSVQAAEAHLLSVRQQELLRSARMHADLLQSFMSKYLAFQGIEQGKVQMKADRHRFEAGETDRFEVTQSEVALIDRYERYLKADNGYHAASLALAGQLGADPSAALVPEGFIMQDGDPAIAPVNLIPEYFTLAQVQKLAQTRPEARELQFRKEALKLLVKASMGLDRRKKEAELHQLELEGEKAQKASEIMAEKAFDDYRLAAKGIGLARQRYDLASRAMRQLQISHEAGFSSSKDVLDGQVELARAKTALIGAQVAYNLSQIQLLYEMGLLSEDIFSRPLAIPPNLL